MKKLTSFIVEDNLDSLNLLCNDIKTNFQELEIIGKARSVIEAAKKLQTVKPDILFLDIMLGDGTSFDILEIVPNLNSKIIFITANDDFAIKAFKFSAIDYILKPYSLENLSNSIEKAKQQIIPRNNQINVLKEIIRSPNQIPTKITLNTSEKIIVVEIENIIRCQSDNNYTTFYLKNGNKILVSKTLKNYANLLCPIGFIRVHQSHLVNKNYIKEYIKSDGGYLILYDKTNIPVSFRKRGELIEQLNKM